MRHQLCASPIEAKTKGEIRRLRNTGYIPVSIQHRGDPTIHLMEETKPLQEFIHQYGQSLIIDLIVEPGKKKHTVMVHSIQRDPLSQKVTQVTYQKINRSDEIHTHVPLQFFGEPESVKHGTAVAQHPLELIEIRCSQAHLPENFTVDVSHLQVGDVMRAGDIKHDSHVTIVTPADTVIMSLKHIAVTSAPEAQVKEEAVPSQEGE